MTHQPPIPEAATSPYPLHPAPIPEERKMPATDAVERASAGAKSGHGDGTSTMLISLGAVVGVAAVATGILYVRDRSKKVGGTSATGSSGGDHKTRPNKLDRSAVGAG